MRTKVLWGLVLLNVALAASLVARATRENAALAQDTDTGAGAGAGAGARVRVNDVIMIPGEVSGGANAIIYVVATVNNQKRLGAMAFDGQNLEFMAPVDVERLFEENGPMNINGTRTTRTPTR